MKIGIIGDTHRNLKNIDIAINYLMDCDYILHTGDNFSDSIYIHKETEIKTIAVKGNCDYGDIEKEIIFDLQGYTFFLTHGHEYEVKNNIDLIKTIAKLKNADIVVFGHSHKNINFYDDDILFINPGSIHSPRDGGDKGFYKLNINNNNIDIIRIKL